MGSAVTVNALRGILVHDERVNASSFSTSLSTYSEAGAHPGVPVPTSASSMVLESSGEMSSGTVTIRTTRAGGVSSSPDGEIEPGAFALRTNGTDWLGWNGPLVFAGWSPLHTFASGGAANQYANLHTIHTDDGTMLTAAQRFTSLGATRSLVVLRTVGTTTTTIVLDTQAIGLVAYCPTLVRLPEGRLLLLSTKTVAAGQYTIRAWVSTDDGATWTKSADSTIRDELDGTATPPRRLRAAYSAGQVLMVLAFRDTTATVADSFRQYASSDEGASFALVQAVDNTTAANDYTGGVHDIVVTPSGSFVAVFCASSRTTYGANSAVLYKVLPSAWVAWQTVVSTTLSALSAPSASLSVGGQLSASTELCATRDDDGTVYVLAVDFVTNQQTQIARSTTEIFTTWTEVGFQSATVPNVPLFAGTGNEWVGGTVSAYNGTLRLISQWDSATWPGQIGCTAIAGYTTACVPWSPASEARSDALLGSRLTWLPYWLPDSAGWTLATAGIPVVALNAGGYLNLQVPGAAVNTYTQAGPALTANHTVAAFAEWAAITQRSELRLASSNGTNTYGFRVRYSGTTVDVLDSNGGATLATTTITASTTIHVRAFLENNGAVGCNAVVYLSTSAGGLATLRPATRICNVSTVSDAGVTAAATSVTWGQFNQANAAESRWYGVGWQAVAGVSSVYNLTLPTDLPGRPFSAYPQLLAFGMSARAVAGPTLVGDEWTITPRHDYAVENVLASVAPSPRQTWRSTDATQQILTWVIETGAGAVTPLRGPLGALYLGGCNFRTATLEGRNGAGVFVTIGTIDMSASSAPLRWTRAGTMIEPDTTAATSAGYFWPNGILRGARFVPDTTAAAGLTAKAISSSSEGGWTNLAGRKLRLEIANTSGIGASGTSGAIVHRSGLLVWNNDPRYNAYRLTIPTQHTVESYFEIGTLALGHVMAFGRRYSWGRTMQTAANTALTTGRSGARRAQNFGPARRSVEFGWTDGTDVSAVRTGTPADYVNAAASGGGEAAATWYDAPLSMDGLVRELYGSATPVVYLPWIERKALGTVYQASHPDLMLFGRIVSDVSIETVQGEEWLSADGATGEVVRTSSIRLEEEV
jgi:hypothetical protein